MIYILCICAKKINKTNGVVKGMFKIPRRHLLKNNMSIYIVHGFFFPIIVCSQINELQSLRSNSRGSVISVPQRGWPRSFLSFARK